MVVGLETSFASSSAPNADYYKRIALLERGATTPKDQLDDILSTPARSPAEQANALQLALYLRSLLPTPSRKLDESLLTLAIQLLPHPTHAVLAYQACLQLFPEDQEHPLKLLLVNTIRRDLLIDRSRRQHCALKALACSNIVTKDVVPAVEHAVLELLDRPLVKSHLRSLALQALATMLQVVEPAPSHLLPAVHAHVLKTLSTSTSTTGELLRALSVVKLLRRRFGEFGDGSVKTTNALLELLSRIRDGPPRLDDVQKSSLNHRGTDTLGRQHLLAIRTLETLHELLQDPGSPKAIEPSRPVVSAVRKTTLYFLSLPTTTSTSTAGSTEDDLSPSARAVISAALVHFSAAVFAAPSSTSSVDEQQVAQFEIKRLKSRLVSGVLRRALTKPVSSRSPEGKNEQLWALRLLASMSPAIWAESSNSKAREAGEEDEGLGEAGFAAILKATRDGDPSIRRSAIELLTRVDLNLVDLAFQRLADDLEGLQDADKGASTAALKQGSHDAEQEKLVKARRKAALVERLVELPVSVGLPQPFPPSSADPLKRGAWAYRRIRELVRHFTRKPGRDGGRSRVVAPFFPLLLVAFVDRFAATCAFSIEDPHLRAFAEAALSAGEWKVDPTLALIVAATAGVGVSPDPAQSAEERTRAADELSAFVDVLLGDDGEELESDQDGPMPEEARQALIEPFVTALIRLPFLDCRAPTFNDAESGPFHSGESAPDALLLLVSDLVATFSSHPKASACGYLLSQFARLSDPENEEAREAVSRDERRFTLPGFVASMEAHLARSRSTSGSATSSSSSPFTRDTASLSTTSDGGARPLRYTAYPTPSDAGTPRASAIMKVKVDEKRVRKERERDRKERGGRGGMAVSIMTAGELALATADDGDLSSDDESLPDGRLRVREDGEEAGGSNDTLRREKGNQDRTREESVSSEDTSMRQSEPPRDLLVELEGDLFHSS